MSRTYLSGADLVLPDRVASGHALVIEGDRIVDIASGPRMIATDEVRLDRAGHFVLPGFIDVHVHGAAGGDVLDGDGAVATLAKLMPRWGVTAFCPTTVACAPEALHTFLTEVARLRGGPRMGARVLPAHLESNFVNPAFRGAQPLACLRLPPTSSTAAVPAPKAFTAHDVLGVIDRARPDVGIVTMAPELEGGEALVKAFVAGGIVVSLGHSGATFEQAQAAIALGARQATHLFNRMSGMNHRDPGLAGAVLASEDVAAELICDGHHVHPAVMNVAIAAKGPSRVMAITDGTAGSGLASGARAKLGGATITVGDVARLDDGTTAGSVLTMDRALAMLVTQCGLDIVLAARMCATTPARELGLGGHGAIAAGAVADFVVLDPHLRVVETWIGGQRAWPEPAVE
jgi:N-acetylglucosamine-6-phosphate deacetylase